jgi:hypothetical protein
VALVSDEPIPMTDWEVHDFAVQVVRDSLKRDGVEIVQAHGCPPIDPALWTRRRGRLEWVIVRAVRYPMLDAKLPENWRAITEACRRESGIGSFASVSLARADDPSCPIQVQPSRCCADTARSPGSGDSCPLLDPRPLRRR